MPATRPGVAYSLTIRAEYDNVPGMLGKITSAIGQVKGDINAVDVVEVSHGKMIRDFTV
ncbi:MAG: NAD-dependent malic enzyme, partial [Chloroflexi bacterium]|nr:NAD-dependent malic enzyme [Chloroflexota bacterium]